MIYQEVLGDAAIHLTTYNGKARAKRCALGAYGSCRCYYFVSAMEKKPSFGLGLLTTCRIM
jgi:hypothetical protein